MGREPDTDDVEYKSDYMGYESDWRSAVIRIIRVIRVIGLVRVIRVIGLIRFIRVIGLIRVIRLLGY